MRVRCPLATRKATAGGWAPKGSIEAATVWEERAPVQFTLAGVSLCEEAVEGRSSDLGLPTLLTLEGPSPSERRGFLARRARKGARPRAMRRCEDCYDPVVSESSMKGRRFDRFCCAVGGNLTRWSRICPELRDAAKRRTKCPRRPARRRRPDRGRPLDGRCKRHASPRKAPCTLEGRPQADREGRPTTGK